jgi:hypothetical protein
LHVDVKQMATVRGNGTFTMTAESAARQSLIAIVATCLRRASLAFA